MSVANVIAWVLVGLSFGIAGIGFVTIGTVIWMRVADRSRGVVLRDALRGRRP